MADGVIPSFSGTQLSHPFSSLALSAPIRTTETDGYPAKAHITLLLGDDDGQVRLWWFEQLEDGGKSDAGETFARVDYDSHNHRQESVYVAELRYVILWYCFDI